MRRKSSTETMGWFGQRTKELSGQAEKKRKEKKRSAKSDTVKKVVRKQKQKG